MADDPRSLLKEADKTLASAGGGFSFFGGREDKYSNAADLYTRATNAFHLQKMNREAGQAFEKAAEVHHTKLNEPSDAANILVDTFKVYKQENPQDAVRCLEVSISHYCQTGSFRRAAQYKENSGEVLETQIGDTEKTLDCYKTAAEWLDSDNASA